MLSFLYKIFLFVHQKQPLLNKIIVDNSNVVHPPNSLLIETNS